MKSFILVLIVMSNSSNTNSIVSVTQEYSSEQTCQVALVKLVGQAIAGGGRVVAKLCSEK